MAINLSKSTFRFKMGGSLNQQSKCAAMMSHCQKHNLRIITRDFGQRTRRGGMQAQMIVRANRNLTALEIQMLQAQAVCVTPYDSGQMGYDYRPSLTPICNCGNDIPKGSSNECTTCYCRNYKPPINLEKSNYSMTDSQFFRRERENRRYNESVDLMNSMY